jgi:hypothetical protein
MSKIFPVKDVTVEKQGDGTYIVNVIHQQGVVSQVLFPYTYWGQDLAEEYAKHISQINHIKEEVEQVTAGLAAQQATSPSLESALTMLPSVVEGVSAAKKILDEPDSGEKFSPAGSPPISVLEHVSVAVPVEAQQVLSNPKSTKREIKAALQKTVVTPDPIHKDDGIPGIGTAAVGEPDPAITGKLDSKE